MACKTDVQKKIDALVDDVCLDSEEPVTPEDLKRILYEFFCKIDFADK